MHQLLTLVGKGAGKAAEIQHYEARREELRRSSEMNDSGADALTISVLVTQLAGLTKNQRDLQTK